VLRQDPSVIHFVSESMSDLASCCSNTVGKVRGPRLINEETGDFSVRIEGRPGVRRYLSIVRAIGLSVMGLSTGTIAGDRSVAEMCFPRRFRGLGGNTVCVLGVAAAYAVAVGLNRCKRPLIEVDRRECRGGCGSPGGGPTAACCSAHYVVGPEEEELHHKCTNSHQPRGLVNDDLLAYLRPYTAFQKRTATLLQVLKGRAMIWRRRQRVSEHCFAHFLPGTLVAAMELSREEVWAVRKLGGQSEAGKLVYEDGIDPSKLVSWFRRGGTEKIWRSGWASGMLKVED